MVNANDASVDNSCHDAIAEDPTCARITLSGHLAPLNSPTASAVDEANGELLPRHVAAKMSPKSRDIHWTMSRSSDPEYIYRNSPSCGGELF